MRYPITIEPGKPIFPGDLRRHPRPPNLRPIHPSPQRRPARRTTLITPQKSNPKIQEKP